MTTTTAQTPDAAPAKHRMRSRSRHVAAAMLLISAVLGGFAANATSATAATSGRCYNSSATCRPVMSTNWVPWNSPSSQGSQYWTIKQGTRVDMRCWTTGASRLGTSKWFYVVSQSYPFTRGYVPANAVASQIAVGHC